MNIIKLDATESTNLFLKDLVATQDLPDFTVVSCYDQTNGRGQRGSNWVSEPGKNLTFSVLKSYEGLIATDQFKITIAVSLAIYHVLKRNKLQKVFIKWPNDIMAGNKKICGILIENILQGSRISKSIIGIGLNVNQNVFNTLEKATSMRLQCARDFDLEKILAQIVNQLEIEFEALHLGNSYKRYLGVLYKYQLAADYIDMEGAKFSGKIMGVDPDGSIQIITEETVLKRFKFKEVRMIY